MVQTPRLHVRALGDGALAWAAQLEIVGARRGGDAAQVAVGAGLRAAVQAAARLEHEAAAVQKRGLGVGQRGHSSSTSSTSTPLKDERPPSSTSTTS